MHGPSKRMQSHPSPAQPPPTTHDLSALREHKRVTIPQCASSSNTTKRTKGTMKALSHRKLMKIYGHVSVGIMKRKGCCGVALRDCSTRTPIAIANHDNTGIGFVASSVAAHRRGRRHKHRPYTNATSPPSQSPLFPPKQSPHWLPLRHHTRLFVSRRRLTTAQTYIRENVPLIMGTTGLHGSSNGNK